MVFSGQRVWIDLRRRPLQMHLLSRGGLEGCRGRQIISAVHPSDRSGGLQRHSAGDRLSLGGGARFSARMSLHRAMHSLQM